MIRLSVYMCTILVGMRKGGTDGCDEGIFVTLFIVSPAVLRKQKKTLSGRKQFITKYKVFYSDTRLLSMCFCLVLPFSWGFLASYPLKSRCYGDLTQSAKIPSYRLPVFSNVEGRESTVYALVTPRCRHICVYLRERRVKFRSVFAMARLRGCLPGC